jgi:hypothetical protein
LIRAGSTFRLKSATIATVIQEGKWTAVQIPAGAEVSTMELIPVNESEGRHQQIGINWEGKTMKMFLIDLQERGEHIQNANDQ